MKETISSFYAKDHDRLDELFKEYQAHKKSDYAKAKKAFLEFNQGLRQHIQWEEDLLFPLFEKKTAMTHCGPTEVMRQEHVEIQERLNQIKGKVHHADPNTDDQERALLGVLGNHNAKEEEILYPMIDQVSDGNEKEELFKKMKNSLIKSNCCCC